MIHPINKWHLFVTDRLAPEADMYHVSHRRTGHPDGKRQQTVVHSGHFSSLEWGLCGRYSSPSGRLVVGLSD